MSPEESRAPFLSRLRPAWRHIRERKLVAWTGSYIGVSWTTKEIVEWGATFVTLPQMVIEAVPVVLFTGLGLTVVVAYFHGERGRQRVSRGEATLLALILVVGLIFLGGIPGNPFDTYRVEDPRGSYLVDPTLGSGASSTEVDLALDAAAALSNFLRGWDEIQVRSQLQAGLVASLGLEEPFRSSLGESFALARENRVGTLAVVLPEVFGEVAEIQVTLFDVMTEQQLGPAMIERGSPGDIQGLVLPIGQKILGLAGAPPELLLERETASLAAMQQTIEGRRLLEQWELERAEAVLRGALRSDSTLGRAHRDLGMTLYWQAAIDPSRGLLLDAEMVQHAVLAVRYARLLPFRDSLHALAFRGLALGEFEDARNRYGDLLRRDDSDVFAWLMLGATEYTDQGMVDTPSGQRPRPNWNSAQRAFLRAVQLAPDITLGYGYLFDLYREVTGERTGCPPSRGFRTAGSQGLATAQAAAAGRLEYFCPVFLDSLEWLRPEQLAELDRAVVGVRGDDLAALALDRLRLWRDYRPSSPRPLHELARWFLEQRRRVGGSRSRFRADSLASEALRHTTAALALTRDTTPETLLELASLTLAAGDLETALAHADLGLALLESRDGPEWVPPHQAINPYLAAGRIERVRDLVDRAYGDWREFQLDTLVNRPLELIAGRSFHRIRYLGGLGTEALIDPEFTVIEEAWDVADYTERERRLLRGPRGRLVAPALVHSELGRSLWAVADSVLWAPWSLSGAERDEALDRALSHYRSQPSRPEWAFALGALCERSGRPADAVDLLRDVRAAPIAVELASAAWGFEVMAALMEGRAREALADPAAIESYDYVVRRWQSADPHMEPWVREAREARARLGGA
ncbi:MAG: hypothetical protein HKN71_00035 [Gemmatimonadetes bacterium]|nr:hypothetical protein [Gemmatimonadota bacterium]